MQNIKVWLSVVFFVAVGLLCFFYRQLNVPTPIIPEKEVPRWQLEIKVNFLPLRNPLLINWELPSDNNGFRLLDEFFVTKGYGVEKEDNLPLQSRPSRWSKRYSLNAQTVYYRALIAQSGEHYRMTPAEVDIMKKFYLESYRESRSAELLKEKLSLQDKDGSPMAMAVAQLLDNIREKTISPKIFVRRLIRMLEENRYSANALVQGDINTLRNTTEVAWALSNHIGIPVRIANGILIGERGESHKPIVRWLEVLDEEDNKWERVFLGDDGRNLPKENLFALWYGKLDMLNVPNGLRESYVVSLDPAATTPTSAAIMPYRGNSAQLFSMINLGQLPIGSQILLKFLLVIPLGTLILAFARQFIGIKMFGSFMPILLALSFKETGLIMGLILLGGLVLGGLIARSYLAQLKLLFVPRIGAVITLLILLIAAIAIFCRNAHIESGLAVFLFPIVILVMLIERISLMLDEAGPQEALETGLGTLCLVVACYFVINNPQVRYFFFTFPETLLIIVGLHILLGRYAGFRLTEYIRFRDLLSQQPESGSR